MKIQFNRINNEKGYTLLLTLVVFVILSTLGLSIIFKSQNTLKTSMNERLDQSVYYIAEAGLIERSKLLQSQIKEAYDEAVAEFKNKINENPSNYQTIDFKQIFKNQLDNKVDKNKTIVTDFEKQFSHAPTAEVTVNENQQGDEITYKVVSTGTINNKSRKVSQDLIVNLNSVTIRNGGNNDIGNAGEFAIYVSGNITFGYYNMKDNIKGKLASSSVKQVDVKGWYPEPIYITHDETSFDQIVDEIFKEELAFDETKFENVNYSPNSSPLIKNNNIITDWNEHHNKVLPLTDHLKINKFTMFNNLTFNIDVGNTDKILYVDELTFNGTLNILGEGSLTIFVKNKLIFNYSNININGDPSKLNIYYAGSNPISIGNGSSFKGNIFIKNANLTISNGAGYSGSFYSGGSGSVTINGGTVGKDVTFIMPNYDFTVTGGANIVGSILGKNILFDGGAKVDAQAGGGLIKPIIDIDTSSNPYIIKSIVEQ